MLSIEDIADRLEDRGADRGEGVREGRARGHQSLEIRKTEVEVRGVEPAVDLENLAGHIRRGG